MNVYSMWNVYLVVLNNSICRLLDFNIERHAFAACFVAYQKCQNLYMANMEKKMIHGHNDRN